MISVKQRMANFRKAPAPEKCEQALPQRKTPLSPRQKRQVVSSGKVVDNRVSHVRQRPKDWDYLYKLAIKYDKFREEENEEKKSRANARPLPAQNDESTGEAPKKDIKKALEGMMGGNYTSKADWLNKEWIDQRMVWSEKSKSFTFRFNDAKLFKKYTKTDEAERDKIVKKFVGELLRHPKSNEITKMDLSNALLPDEFLIILAGEILKDPANSFQNLQVLNLESNLLQGPGIEALAEVIGHDVACKFLQVLMLENQGKVMTSEAESALAKGIGCSPSLVVCSLRVRGPVEKKEIDDVTAYNLDQLRQARREHATKTGTLKARKRNEMELYFDKIAANDASITEVNLVGDQKFLALNSTEKTKSGSAFATNTHVKTLKMQKLGLDDSFAKEFGNALAKNTTIEKVVIDSNAITGEGIKALFAGLGKNPNTAVVEFQVRHQSKVMSSADEESLADLLEANTSIIKLGVDCRNQLIKMKLDKKTNTNRELQRKLRVQAKNTASC